MKGKSFIIAGDSWGCGEWAKTAKGYHVTHGGLAQWLHESGHCIYNLSQPGGSNMQAVQRVENFFDNNPWLHIDGVFVFETEWTRDSLIKFQHKKQFACFADAEQEFKHKFYNALIRLSEKTQRSFHLIGGQADTINGLRFGQDLSGVQIVCQSMTNLVVNNSALIDQPVFAMWNSNDQYLLDMVPNNQTTKQEFVDRVDWSTTRADMLARNKQWFWPDGLHANRHAHHRLWTHLTDTYPSIFE